MGALLHASVHLIAGAAILLLFMNKYMFSFRDCFYTVFLGATLAITPDLTKFFGDILLHSILVAPLVGALYAWIIVKLFKKTSYLYAWISSVVTVVVGHLFIDYLGNGVNLLYPLTNEEQNFSILGSNHEIIITIILALGVISTCVWRKTKVPLVITTSAILLFLVTLAVSNASITRSLQQQYASEKPEYIVVYPSSIPFYWNYYVRIDHLNIIAGEGSYLNVTK